jgi:hypothetical protein
VVGMDRVGHRLCMKQWVTQHCSALLILRLQQSISEGVKYNEHGQNMAVQRIEGNCNSCGKQEDAEVRRLSVSG